jgi:hypothetical protein
MTLLTPLGALVALAVLLPLAAAATASARTDAVRRRLALPSPARRSFARPLLAALAVALLGLAAAQPALTSATRPRSRTDAQVIFVLDISRSMAASESSRSATRLARAAAAAVRLRNAVGDVPAGVLTLTDRVLPDLLPVADRAGFDAVVTKAVRIESPPPRRTAARATDYAALAEIAQGNDFAPDVRTKIVVLLSDGESDPVQTSDVARSFAGYRFLAVRFWRAGEAVYGPDGASEAAYRPDPAGAATLHDLAAALGGRSFDEAALRPAAAYLRKLAGTGRATAGPATERRRTPLAPYVALAALLAALGHVIPTGLRLTRR